MNFTQTSTQQLANNGGRSAPDANAYWGSSRTSRARAPIPPWAAYLMMAFLPRHCASYGWPSGLRHEMQILWGHNLGENGVAIRTKAAAVPETWSRRARTDASPSGGAALWSSRRKSASAGLIVPVYLHRS